MLLVFCDVYSSSAIFLWLTTEYNIKIDLNINYCLTLMVVKIDLLQILHLIITNFVINGLMFLLNKVIQCHFGFDYILHIIYCSSYTHYFTTLLQE